MWWRGQQLSENRTDSDGTVWHFRVWHDSVDGVLIQRIFFWDAARSQTGAIELAGDSTLHVSRIRQLIAKIVTQKAFRVRHLRKLRFPIERHYGEYFPFD